MLTPTVLRGVTCRGILPALMLVWPASTHAQSISPKFAWPTAATAELTSAGHRSLTLGGSTDSMPFRTRSMIEVRPDVRGVRIAASVIDSVEGYRGKRPEIADLLRLPLRYLVSRDGRFLELDDTVRTRQHLDSAALPVLRDLRESPLRSQSGMRRMFSMESLLRQTERLWWQETGALISRSWMPGDTAVFRFTEMIPDLPGVDIPFVEVMRYEGTMTCPTHTAASRCWRFTSNITVDKVALRKSASRMLGEIAIGDTSMVDALPMPDISESHELVYDAATSRLVERVIRRRTVFALWPGEPPTVTGMNAVMRYSWK